MNTILPILLAALAVAVVSIFVWFIRARIQHRRYFDGRRDAFNRRVNELRAQTDRDYFDGVVDQRIADTREGRDR